MRRIQSLLLAAVGAYFACMVSSASAQTCPNCRPTPQQIYRPVITYQPYQLQGYSAVPVWTPIRGVLRGIFQTRPYYVPHYGPLESPQPPRLPSGFPQQPQPRTN